MTLEQAHIQTAMKYQSQSQANTRLQGGWLLLARITWIVVLALAVSLYIVSIPFVFADAHTICASAACSNNSYLTLDQVRGLQHLGLSLDFYATFTIVLSILLECVYMAIGVVIFWRRSDDRMVLLSSLALITFGASFRGFNPEPALSSLLYVMSFIMAFFGNCCLGLFFFVFPTGKFAPRWTGLLALGWIVYWGINNLILATILTYPGLDFAVFLGLLVSVIATQVYRYRRVSTSEERQQTKWVVFGISLALLGVLTLFTLSTNVTPDIIPDLIGGSLLYVFLMLIPLSIGIAILHAHLWDIDLIIKRTLVYSTLTACVVGMYVLVVGYLGALFHNTGNVFISLIAAGLVAVAFQPLRNLLQRGVNRLLYGLRDEPYVVLAGLGQRLKTTLDPDAVLSTIVETVREALKLSYAAIEVKEGPALALAASAGTPPAKEALRLPLVYQSEPVGTLILAPRGHDDSLTSADLHLLQDLTYQIGSAVHTVRLNADLRTLTRDLQRSREHLITAREEERRRLRRDLHDGLGPMLSAIILKVGLVRTLHRRDPETTDTLLNQLEEEIESVIGDIRRVVYNLRPPALDELGLVGAIREYVARFGTEEQAHNVALKITVETPASLPPLPAAVEVATYRIVQEALTNVFRHAHAQSCHVRLLVEKTLQIEVSDDGMGFEEADRAGVGLTSMRERAEELGGTFAISKTVPCGTQITACFPLSDVAL